MRTQEKHKEVYGLYLLLATNAPKNYVSELTGNSIILQSDLLGTSRQKCYIGLVLKTFQSSSQQ
jgi:hypothetical protein